tara:strand:- start:209 stop:742 length:534 start_codon:yes stop_codon:yes gene_type:complete
MSIIDDKNQTALEGLIRKADVINPQHPGYIEQAPSFWDNLLYGNQDVQGGLGALEAISPTGPTGGLKKMIEGVRAQNYLKSYAQLLRMERGSIKELVAKYKNAIFSGNSKDASTYGRLIDEVEPTYHALVKTVSKGAEEAIKKNPSSVRQGGSISKSDQKGFEDIILKLDNLVKKNY